MTKFQRQFLVAFAISIMALTTYVIGSDAIADTEVQEGYVREHEQVQEWIDELSNRYKELEEQKIQIEREQLKVHRQATSFRNYQKLLMRP